MIAKLLHLASHLIASLVVATVIAQGVLAGALWYQGALTRQKMERYAAILYGIPAKSLPSPGASTDEQQETTSASLELEERARQDPLLADRETALQRSFLDFVGLVQELKKKRQRYDFVKQSFEDLLEELEQQLSTSALTEVQRTLEVLQPKQAKELVLQMLDEEDPDDRERALQDVVTILTTMSADKLKKIAAEFKTDEERRTLHEILVEIGNLRSRQLGGLDS